MTILLNFAALVILVTSVLAQDSTCARSYIVKVNDDCDTISAAQNVSTFQLRHVNPNINAQCSNLVPEEFLCLGINGQDCDKTTVVRTGDGCQTISANAGITTTLLLENNPNVNSTCANIYPGEVLCTANSLVVYSP